MEPFKPSLKQMAALESLDIFEAEDYPRKLVASCFRGKFLVVGDMAPQLVTQLRWLAIKAEDDGYNFPEGHHRRIWAETNSVALMRLAKKIEDSTK